MRIAAVIPARYGSTRLPGKPLLAETGKPLICHVVESARRARRLDAIVVATDDPRIADAVASFGGDVELTRPDHPSGSDRVAEVVARRPGIDIVVNLQGDEPEIEGATIDRLVELLASDTEAPMGTLCTPIFEESVYRNPGCVKVVISSRCRALYFSRSPIPHHRDGPPASGLWGHLHLGLYAYRRDFLLRMAEISPSALESAERLEQLRVLEGGWPIAIDSVEEFGVGIDTPEDYALFVARWRAGRVT